MPFGYIPNAELSGVVLKNLVLEAIGYMHKCRLTVVCGCIGAMAVSHEADVVQAQDKGSLRAELRSDTLGACTL